MTMVMKGESGRTKRRYKQDEEGSDGRLTLQSRAVYIERRTRRSAAQATERARPCGSEQSGLVQGFGRYTTAPRRTILCCARRGLCIGLVLGSRAPWQGGDPQPHHPSMATCRLMLLHRLALLAVWVSQLYSDAGAGLSGDQSTRLRIKWQASIREARLNSNNRGVSPPHPITAGRTKQLLYCRIGIGYHLQILPNGTVGGVHEHTEYSWLKVFAMKQGVVGVQGLKSGLYLCMNRDGASHGLSLFTADCLFRESLEENHYTTYSSFSYPGFYLALSPRGQARKGGSVSKLQPCTHFLPRRVQ